MNKMDIVSFRDLYGFMTADREQEIAAMRASSGAREVSRENAEVELFGAKDSEPGASGSAPNDAEGAATAPIAKARYEKAPAARARVAPLEAGEAGKTEVPVHSHAGVVSDTYDPKDLEQGVVLNAAVIVKDERQIPRTMKDIEIAGQKSGLPLKVVSWQKASGFLGQFAGLMRAVLFTAVLIIFVVALVVINNALVMATLERVREIGMLRAIGAQRRFILGMLVIEAIVVGVLFGALGSSIGAILLSYFGKRGIPAAADALTFFFSGPRLYPTVGLGGMGFAMAIVVFVSIVSSLYPAFIATRVSPREAMQSEE
jgi:hypothetical protein